jgi:hypothetical protein
MIGCIDNPIIVDSIRNEINFLNNLVTKEGNYILYHRLGSIHNNDQILDHYEAMDCTGKKYELYIDSYGDKIVPIPPDGFLFESDCFGSTYNDFFDGDDEDIEEKYIYKRTEDQEYRPIDRYISESYGLNTNVDFPKDIINMMMEKGIIYIPEYSKQANTEENVKKVILEYFKS